MDENLEEAVRQINDLSEDEKEECRQDLKELEKKTKTMHFNMKRTASALRVAAKKLDKVWRDCKIAHAAGTTGGIVSACLALSLTVATGGAALPLLVTGLGIGIGGAVTNLGTSCIEASINSAEIKKAEKLLEETLDSIDVVNKTVQGWLDYKEKARLLYICYLAEILEMADPTVMKILREVMSGAFGISIEIMKKLAAAAVACKAGTKAATKVGAQGAGKALIQVTDDVAQAGKAGIQVADDVAQVGKAGIQVADDVAQAGTKAGSTTAGKCAGKVFIIANIAFLMWDVADLGFTIRDLVKNNGSEAAKCLREKAKELEELVEELVAAMKQQHSTTVTKEG